MAALVLREKARVCVQRLLRRSLLELWEEDAEGRGSDLPPEEKDEREELPEGSAARSTLELLPLGSESELREELREDGGGADTRSEGAGAEKRLLDEDGLRVVDGRESVSGAEKRGVAGATAPDTGAPRKVVVPRELPRTTLLL